MSDHDAASLADLLNNLATRLAEAGRGADALAKALEARDLYRDLVARDPWRYLPGLHGLLNNLAIHQARAGRPLDALASAQEASDIGRELAVHDRDTYLPDLALALHNLATRQSDVGHAGEAVRSAQELSTCDASWSASTGGRTCPASPTRRTTSRSGWTTWGASPRPSPPATSPPGSMGSWSGPTATATSRVSPPRPTTSAST